ncbi:hypothetical protein [Actinomadura parmotrematis]|uniref:GNAT family N-acetyltransferase n=1 Tax=Actinomadura parmotrematis TaxID=2864039 RepID=A0ABS7FZB3_9ACTN|nr:hypothetical protein [Actinomadura parmotrematis]MBW8485280.1 hypothetical protein [Actinomadura parmotrematis]
MAIDERDVRRTTADLDLRRVGGADRYANRTDGPVRHLTVAAADGTVLGYLWAGEDGASAGFVRRADGGDAAGNEAVAWSHELRAAKERGVPAASLLAEFAAASLPVAPNANHTGRVLPGSERSAPSLDALTSLAAS